MPDGREAGSYTCVMVADVWGDFAATAGYGYQFLPAAVEKRLLGTIPLAASRQGQGGR